MKYSQLLTHEQITISRIIIIGAHVANFVALFIDQRNWQVTTIRIVVGMAQGVRHARYEPSRRVNDINKLGISSIDSITPFLRFC